MALVFAPAANAVLASVRSHEAGQASGAMNAIRELGGVLVVAVLATVFSAHGGYGSSQLFVRGLPSRLRRCRRSGRGRRLRPGGTAASSSSATGGGGAGRGRMRSPRSVQSTSVHQVETKRTRCELPIWGGRKPTL
jgi:hypothetical protein